MDEKLYNFIMKLPKENIVNLMFMSLDEMQGYNGQSINECIFRSLGAEGGKKISLREAKELTKNGLPFD
jgi:hypothetical protein